MGPSRALLVHPRRLIAQNRGPQAADFTCGGQTVDFVSYRQGIAGRETRGFALSPPERRRRFLGFSSRETRPSLPTLGRIHRRTSGSARRRARSRGGSRGLGAILGRGRGVARGRNMFGFGLGGFAPRDELPAVFVQHLLYDAKGIPVHVVVVEGCHVEGAGLRQIRRRVQKEPFENLQTPLLSKLVVAEAKPSETSVGREEPLELDKHLAPVQSVGSKVVEFEADLLEPSRTLAPHLDRCPPPLPAIRRLIPAAPRLRLGLQGTRRADREGASLEPLEHVRGEEGSGLFCRAARRIRSRDRRGRPRGGPL
mmetsp:Transcript_3135/g.7244  ORF Transcript_3135/g.7244 Transcript_3135/m.7244 type:complete len:311 (-) Transcript_3135:1540-2472(-)